MLPTVSHLCRSGREAQPALVFVVNSTENKVWILKCTGYYANAIQAVDCGTKDSYSMWGECRIIIDRIRVKCPKGTN
jgi:hypothetical protein